MINIAIIGLGYWGPNYLRIFSQLDGCKVAACAEMDVKRHAAFKKHYPNVAFYSDVQTMINDKSLGLNAVVIATPTSTHFTVAKMVLNHGLDILIEKPLTLTSVESEELCKIAANHSPELILMVGHTFLYNKAVAWIKDFIDAQKAGKIHYIHAQRTNLGPIRHDVNAMIDLAPHDISMILHFLGKPSKVSARGSAFLKKDREDVAFIDLTFENGSTGHIHVSWLEPRKVRQLTVIGDGKMIHFDDVNVSEPVRIFDKGIDKPKEYSSFGEFQMVFRDGDITIPKIGLSEPLKTQCEAFLSAVSTRKKPLSDGKFGLDVVRVLEKATESLKADGKTLSI